MPLPQQVGYPPHSGTIRMKVPKSPARSMGLPSPFALALALVMGAALLATATVSAAQPLLFNQAAVKANTATCGFGPDASKPHFTVRFAMPIPPDNDYSNRGGAMVGIDEAVADYNHSTSFPRPPVRPPALSTAFTPKANSLQEDDISSVAYWYQQEPHAPFPKLPGRDELTIPEQKIKNANEP